LNEEKVRNFSKLARSHICACHAFEDTQNNNSNNLAVISCAKQFEKIEQTMVQKTHRRAFVLIESFATPKWREGHHHSG
jgi:hypothetical protein